MQVSEKWKLVHSLHNVISPVYSVAIKPNQSELITQNSSHLYMYNIKDSTLTFDQKKHKGTIYAIGCSQRDSYFATGSNDKTVIVWDSQTNKAIIKFATNDTPTSITFNPNAPQLIATAGNEFFIWTPQTRQVSPVSAQGRILCSAWAPDGKLFALGLINGTLSVRTNADVPQEIYTHHLQVPIFAVCWSNELLLAGDWDNRLTIHKPRDSKLLSTQSLPAQPTSIINFQSNLIITDIAGGVYLYNDDGQLLSEVTQVNEWIWSAAICPNGYLALGLENGTVTLLSLGLKPIYSLFHDAFSIRTELTKIRLHIMGTDLVEDVEFIKPVQAISVTENQVAVKFSDEVSAYTYDNVGGRLELTKLGRFTYTAESKFFFGFANAFMFIQEKIVKVVAPTGNFIREFVFNSPIKQAIVCSTIISKEGLIVGLEDGQVIQIFVHHRFSHLLFKHDIGIKSLSISQMKSKIAVVDDSRRCCVYDLMTCNLLFIEEEIDNACWNELNDDLLALSDGENLFVKAYDMNRIKTPMKGELIRFNGLTASTIVNNELCQVDVSLSTAVRNLARNEQFEKAYNVAVFGSTEESWNELADMALRARNINIAIKSASHSRNVRLLHFISMISHLIKDSKFTNDYLNAEVDAWCNNFDSAARAWTRLGENERALQMYFDLRQFDKLKQYLSGDRMKRFALQQAKIFEDMSEIELAAELYIAGGESLKAIQLLSTKPNCISSLATISKKIDHSESEALKMAADLLMKHDMVKEATDLLAQLDDVSSLARVRVYMKDWNEALSLAKMHPDLLPEVFLPFARHLFEDDQYFESLVSFFIAGRVDEALKSLNTLLENSIIMNKFDDAAFFLYGRSLGLSSTSQDSSEADSFVESGILLAKAYSAFGRLKEDTTSPFNIREQGSSFYLSRFIVAYLNSVKRGEFKERYLHGITNEISRGVSYPESLFSLLNESSKKGEYRLMRWCAEQLSLYVVPPAIQEAIDLAILNTNGMNDVDEGDCCERCGSRLFSGSEGPLLWCSECKSPIIFSSYSFHVLPLVPININGVSPEEAKELIKIDPPIDSNPVEISNIIDPSTAIEGESKPSLNADILKRIDPSNVILCEWKPNSKVPPSFLLNPLLESVHICRGCNSIFNDVDFEQTFLDNGSCPLCKTPLDHEAEGEFADTYEAYSDLLKQLRDFASVVPIEF